MKRWLFLLSFPLLLVANISAQSAHTLHHPTAAEYLDAVSEIAHEYIPPSSYYDPLYAMISSTLLERYPDLYKEDFASLLAVYTDLRVGASFYPRDTWNRILIQSWLRENSVDLSEVTQLVFADYTIEVIPRDFDGDGANEYILDVAKRGEIDRTQCNYDAEYVDYLVIEQQGAEYQWIETPLRWFGYPARHGGVQELRFEDVNADGLPEWILVDGGYSGGGPAMGYVNAGKLYILGWRDEQLIDLVQATDPQNSWRSETVYEEDAGAGCITRSRDVSWEFVNVDSDPPLEILQHQVYTDNWFCESRRTKILDWNTVDNRYHEIDSMQTFAETQNCAQQQAEALMWAGNYAEAIRLFEGALAQPQYARDYKYLGESEAYYTNWLTENLTLLSQYLRLRLALAYIMTGQPELAGSILNPLVDETFTDEALQHFAETLQRHLDQPLLACVGTYNNFTQFYPERVYGITYEQEYQSLRDYFPERIGCDALVLIEAAISEQIFTTSRSPVEQIEAMGLATRKTLTVDLNGDGQDEWLIWLETPMHPFFFAADGAIYRVSEPAIDPYLSMGEATFWTLPNQAGNTLIYLTDYRFLGQPPWLTVYDSFLGGIGGYPLECLLDSNLLPPQRLWMWQMVGFELSSTFNGSLVCRGEVVDLFPEGEGSTWLDAGTLRTALYEGVQIQRLLYQWDSATQIFQPQVETTLIPQPTATTSVEPVQLSEIMKAFEAGNYETVLALSDNLDTNDENALPARYYRAAAFESLEHDNEALVEYFALYNATTDSGWHKLAALHIEGLEDE